MVYKLNSLKELPYKTYLGYVLETEADKIIAGNKTAYLFISKPPVCISLFVEI